MDRAEHLQWCKDRARKEYEFSGDLNDAFASMMSDLRKHDELENHVGISLGMAMNMSGHLSTETEMFKWINGFN
jgi:hypothetical protein